MSEKGILFSTLMVQKLVVEKVKTHTRRTSGLEKLNKNPEDWKLMPQVSADGAYRFYSMKWDESVWCKPRYFKGDILYIKETWKIGAYKYNDKAVIEHKAGGFTEITS